MRKLATLMTICVEPIIAIFAVLAALLLLDYPTLDSYPDSRVNRLRYPNVTNVQRDEDYSRFRINSLGFIGDNPRGPSDQPVLRIAMFGDSFVEALQVDDRDRMTHRLQDILTRRAAAGTVPIEVWNVGFAGDNTGNAFARWLYQVRPGPHPFNYVIFTVNDGDLLENSPGEAAGKFGSFLVPVGNTFELRQSSTYKSSPPWIQDMKRALGPLFRAQFDLRTRGEQYVTKVEGFLARLAAASPLSAQPPASVAITKEAQVESELARETVAQLAYVKERIEKTGVRVVIAGLPTYYAMPAQFPGHDPKRFRLYQALVDEARRVALPIVDTYPALTQEWDRGNDPYSYWDVGGHYNALGHATVAGVIAAQMMADDPPRGIAAPDATTKH